MLQRSRRKIALLFAMIIIAVMLSVSCGGGGNGGGGTGGGESNEVTREVSGLMTGTTYYWKVVADDGNGSVTESEVRSFTTR